MAERKKYNFGNAAKILTNTATSQSHAATHTQELKVEKEKTVGSETDISVLETLAERTETAQQRDVETLLVQERLRQLASSAHSVKAFNFKYIPREKLSFSEDNKYPMEDIEKLGNTILRFGLIHNLEVFYEEETDTYIIESGERRTRAIDGLIERFRNAVDSDAEEYQLYLKNIKQFADEGYPCNVKRQILTESTGLTEKERLIGQIESKIRLRIANEEVREANVVKTRNVIMELNELYAQLNNLLHRQEKVNVNEMVAKEMGISSRQVKNYKATEKLIPELQEMFESSSITLKEGANYAKLSEEEQQQIVTLIRAGEDKKELKILSDKLAEMGAEIQKKEQTIKSLGQARDQAISQAEKEKERAANLKQKMEMNISERELEQTKEQLAAAERSMKKYEKQIQSLEAEKKDNIAALEARLAEKEKQKVTALSKTARTALQLGEILNIIEESTRQFGEVLRHYMEIYETSSGELPPEEFGRKLRNLISRI